MLRLACVLALVVGGDARLVAQAPREPVRGTASIILKLTDSTQGRSVAGTASIAELRYDASLSAGVDTLPDLPEGTWSVRLRALGFEPRTVVMVATPSGSERTVFTVRMTALVPTLDAVNVIARHDQKVLDGIDERMRVASGTLIRAGSPFLATAFDPGDALRAGRGFFWRSPTEVVTRAMGGHCGSARTNLPGTREKLSKEVAIYLDGVRIRGGLETLNNLVRPPEILAIETYPDVLTAPFLWRTLDACAVVAFWTKHALPGGGG